MMGDKEATHTILPCIYQQHGQDLATDNSTVFFSFCNMIALHFRNNIFNYSIYFCLVNSNNSKQTVVKCEI